MSAIFKRDLRSYFTTPVGYVYMAIFLAVNGGAFSMFTIQEGSDSKVASYFTTMIFALIVLIPLLTMKTFSEEKKLKTEQLLNTVPRTTSAPQASTTAPYFSAQRSPFCSSARHSLRSACSSRR